MTYLVIENHLSYSVVLDEAGRFMKVANLHYEIGQRVDAVVPMKEKKTWPKMHIAGGAGSIAACFVVAFSIYWYHFLAPFGAVYLSVNPDVRIDVSRNDTVVCLEGLNDDGKTLIQDYKYRGEPLEAVTDGLMEKAIALGYLSDGDTVTIEIKAPDEEWFIQEGLALRKNLNAYLNDKVTVTVVVQKYGPDQAEPKPAAPAGRSIPAPGGQTGDSGYMDEDDKGGGDSGYILPESRPAGTQPQPALEENSEYDDDDD